MSEFQILKWGILAIVAILLILYYLIQRQRQHKRSNDLKYQADSLGYSFSENGDPSWLAKINNFYLFSQGHSKKFSNVMTGTYSHAPVTIMDYRYTTGSGKNSSTRTQTVLLFESSKAIFPDFELRPENLLDKIGSAFGSKDIDFESYPNFSKQYLLKGSNEPSIRAAFSYSVTLFFEGNPGLCVASNRGQFLFYRAGKLAKPADIPSFLQQGYDIYSLFKV
jgi:hypothetical protein